MQFENNDLAPEVAHKTLEKKAQQQTLQNQNLFNFIYFKVNSRCYITVINNMSKLQQHFLNVKNHNLFQFLGILCPDPFFSLESFQAKVLKRSQNEDTKLNRHSFLHQTFSRRTIFFYVPVILRGYVHPKPQE